MTYVAVLTTLLHYIAIMLVANLAMAETIDSIRR